MLFVLHFAVTWFLIGLSWFVLGVHYPLFQEVPKELFKNYSSLHQAKTTSLVLFPLFFEALSAVLIVLFYPLQPLFLLSTLFLAFVWVTTLFAFRCHQKLERRKTQKVLDRLMQIHLLRTFLWTARGGILIALFS